MKALSDSSPVLLIRNRGHLVVEVRKELSKNNLNVLSSDSAGNKWTTVCCTWKLFFDSP
jgi:hypothetical protein